jgi:hypothetical protein
MPPSTLLFDRARKKRRQSNQMPEVHVHLTGPNSALQDHNPTDTQPGPASSSAQNPQLQRSDSSFFDTITFPTIDTFVGKLHEHKPNHQFPSLLPQLKDAGLLYLDDITTAAKTSSDLGEITGIKPALAAIIFKHATQEIKKIKCNYQESEKEN